MKKVFPSIIILISLSLLGLMFLQLYWIQNAILVQKGKYNNDIETSFVNIKSGLKHRIALTLGYNPASLDWDTDNTIVSNILWSTLSSISTEEINKVITNELSKNEINLPFEFAITENQLFLNNSKGFKQDLIPQSFQRALNFDGNYVFYLYIDTPPNYILKSTIWMIATSLLFTIIIILAFWITVKTVFKQKQLSEIKTDFINNMTHEFKTPLATISIAIDAMGNEKVINNKDQMHYYSNIIREENRRMHKQVEKILTTAKLDSETLELNIQPVNMDEIILNAYNSVSMTLRFQKDDIKLKLDALNHIVEGDEVHLSNLINNLIDNAIKYSKETLHIEIITSNNTSRKSLIFKITDNGIGMSKESLKYIFEKFYRVPTGNLHNVKGFGLGLNYVKTIIEAHKGKIKVESTLGKGTTFIIELPLYQS